ncbi:hypothetical protein ES705_04103 [subsurface metagenome]
MGYGSPGGAATFLDLLDTPETYTGQALKLAKVNAGEDGLNLGLLLSFTDWYAGGAPESYPWVFEADNPIDCGSIGAFFSPIHKNGAQQYVIYVGGGYEASDKDFWRYNFQTKQWQRMEDCPTSIVSCGMAMSPDEKKLVASGSNDKYLQIYDVETNIWTTSGAAPQIGGVDPSIYAAVFADNDTVWCQVRGTTPNAPVKFYKYVISTDTWSTFANQVNLAVSNSWCMSISSDGTKLYAGELGGNYYNLYRYVISTDTYTQLSLGAPGMRFLWSSDRNAKLWWWQEGAENEDYYYYNCDTEAVSALIFEANPQATKHLNGGFYGISAAVIWARSSNPELMSYFGTGYWRLAQKTLTDYNLVVFKKPADGYSILAINKANGFTIPIHLFDVLCLPAGTWEFFYPKDGDYTKLKISGSVLK